MTGEYYAELENNHHYIIVDEEHDRTYYCPAEEASNTLSRILNDKNKTIRKLTEKLNKLSNVKIPVIFEIEREFEDRYEHVAFVKNITLADEFCKKHKDCSYHEIGITKYPLELEVKRDNVRCCESCKYFDSQITVDGFNICELKKEHVCPGDYCTDYEVEL